MPVLLRFLGGLVVAVGAFAICHRLPSRIGLWVDPFLILTVYHSLRHDPVASAFGGSATGLAHDALSGGLFGIHGFANTAVAYLASWVRQRFVIQQPTQVAVLFLLAAGLQTVLLALIQVSMVSDGELPGALDTLILMLTTGAFGLGLYLATERFSNWERGWREKRARRLRLDT